MSYVNGFTQGFGLVNQVVNQQDAKERQQMLDAKDEARYREGLRRSDASDQSESERWNKEFGLREQTLQDTQAQRDVANKQWQKSFDASEKNNSFNRSMKSKEWSLKQDEHNNAMATAALNLHYAGGDLSDEQEGYIRNSVYGGTYNRIEKKKEVYNQHLSTYSNEFTPEQTMQWANHPTSLEIATDTFRNELRVRDKETGNRYEIGGIEIVGGKVVPLFNIYSPEGKQVADKVPATENRTGDKSDLLKGVSIADYKRKVVGAVSFVNQVDQNKKLKRIITKGQDAEQASLAKTQSETNKNNATADYYRDGKGGEAQKGLSREQTQAKESLKILLDRLAIVNDIGQKVTRDMTSQEEQEYSRLLSILSPGGGVVPEAPKIDMNKISDYLKGRNAK